MDERTEQQAAEQDYEPPSAEDVSNADSPSVTAAGKTAPLGSG